MIPIQDWEKKEKLEYLENLMGSEDRFFNNYDKELAILCGDADPEVRQKAIDALWDTPNRENHKRLLSMAGSDPDEKVRVEAIIGLGRYMFELEDILCSDEEFAEECADEEDVPRDDLVKTKEFLVKLFRDTSKPAEERRHALEALGFVFDEEIEKLIQDAYGMDDKLFKISAIFAMGRNGHEKWQKIIIQELKSDDSELKIVALKTAGEIVLAEAGEDILQLTFSGDKAVMQEAVWALGKLGWDKGYNRLTELSESEDPEISGLAEAALEEWHMASGVYDDDDDEGEWEDEEDWDDNTYDDEEEEFDEDESCDDDENDCDCGCDDCCDKE